MASRSEKGPEADNAGESSIIIHGDLIEMGKQAQHRQEGEALVADVPIICAVCIVGGIAALVIIWYYAVKERTRALNSGETLAK